MKLKYIYTLLTLVIALYFVPAQAQTKHKAKKAPAKVVKKAAPKPVAKKPIAKVAPAKPKTGASALGDAAANVKVDTTKKATGGIGGNLSEEIVVTTAYKPVLADAVKIRRSPDLDDKTPFKAQLTYIPVDKRLELNTDIKPLVAMQRPPERDTDITNNYVKVGLGSLKTTFGEVYINNGKDPGLQVGGFLKHFAQNGSINKENTENAEAGIFVKSIGTENSLSAKVDYHYNSNYFFGYDEKLLPPVNLQVDKQHFSTIGGEVELAKNYKDVENDFTYAVKLKGYTFSNAFQGKESNIVLSGFLNQTIKQFYAGVSASLDLSTQQDSLYDHNNSLVRVNPYIKFQGENYKIDAGINLVDEFGFNSSFHIFPAAKLEFQVIPKYVRLFVEAKGDVNKTSLRDFYVANPFLGQNLDIKNSIDQLDISAGLKGTLAPGLGFKIAVFRNSVKNMPLFISDFNLATGYNRFKVIYDGGNSRINGFNGELDYKASDDLDIFGRIEYKQYQMATVAEPWNLPKFVFKGGTVIHISSTVNITGSMIIRGATLDPHPTSLTNSAPTSLASFADLNGGVEYRATHRISVFVNVNNILNTSNQNYLYYPDYGFNIFGGVGFAF